MGILDSLLKRVVRGAIREETNKIDKKVADSIGEEIKSYHKEESKYSVPEEYMHFPQYDGVIDYLSTKDESKYKRCTIDYKAPTDNIDAYREKVENAGFRKMTDVRYEKSNEYIIIEDDGPLHLVFHIKK